MPAISSINFDLDAASGSVPAAVASPNPPEHTRAANCAYVLAVSSMRYSRAMKPLSLSPIASRSPRPAYARLKSQYSSGASSGGLTFRHASSGNSENALWSDTMVGRPRPRSLIGLPGVSPALGYLSATARSDATLERAVGEQAATANRLCRKGAIRSKITTLEEAYGE